MALLDEVLVTNEDLTKIQNEFLEFTDMLCNYSMKFSRVKDNWDWNPNP